MMQRHGPKTRGEEFVSILADWFDMGRDTIPNDDTTTQQGVDMDITAIDNALNALSDGDLVAFEYRQQSGNGRWYKHTCTAVFLNRHTTQYEDQVVISYRPKAGTSHINVRGLDKITVVTPFEQRRGHRGDDGVKLPKQFPGAVEAPR